MSAAWLFVRSALLLILISAPPPPLASAKKQSSAAARREDVPYIKCQVCQKIAREIHGRVANKEAEISPKKVSELQIIEIVENVCNVKKEEADWMLQIDIVEKEDRLELVEQGTEGQCNSECKTIERACQEVIGYSDTDIAEFAYKVKPSVDALADFICRDLSKACSAKPPPVPKGRVPGEPFVPKSSKEAEMDKILRSMQGMPGAPGMKMYSRDDLMNGKNFGGDADEDEDDDDTENDFPSNLAKVLREKKAPEKGLKEKAVEAISEAGKRIKKHFDKVSGKIRRWWRPKNKRSGSKPSKSKANEAAAKAGQAEL